MRIILNNHFSIICLKDNLYNVFLMLTNVCSIACRDESVMLLSKNAHKRGEETIENEKLEGRDRKML